MQLAEYYALHGTKITQASERLFVDEFLFPILGAKIGSILPQYTFIDRTGKARRIDFAYHGENANLALEVNGETYHAEGIIPNEMFDDNLFRQNEILRRGYKLIRFSYSQLQSPKWRPIIADALRELFADFAPELLGDYALQPTELQREALQALAHARESRGWGRGVVVMPTGTGKTIMSAMDAKAFGGKVLFLVHRLDILSQSIAAYSKVWGTLRPGILTGDEKSNTTDNDVLFASKDTLRQPEVLKQFAPDAFDYIVVDEVHHGETPTYRGLLKHFRPKFMLGMTATPDRTDRKDIFELFDYNKVYEVSQGEAIERAFLVPYTYIGLTDDIDYSKIRYQNQAYRVDDLEKFLIIPERNQAIFDAYLAPDKGANDKAIAFCVSIKHAERMAEFFAKRGIAAAAVHSASPDRDELITQFRNDELQIVFTVDLFNEGVDFPNVRVLLFLRPTESRTVFTQQLGRGLRLCAGKDRVRVLDFIGNYKRANQIRKWLASKSERRDETDGNGKRLKKLVYEYAAGCEVKFDAKVEEILDRQDAEDFDVDKQDLREAYFAFAEILQRKPTKAEVDAKGTYPSRLYTKHWGSWLAFLRAEGAYTEASYHYPQGTHLGHILSILWYFGLPSRDGTHLDDRFIRMRGALGSGRLGNYQRQLKYKLQAAMELGILEDDRTMSLDDDRTPELTPLGSDLRSALEPNLAAMDLSFPLDDQGIPSSRMRDEESVYVDVLLTAVKSGGPARERILQTFMGMHAVQQMMAFLYHVARSGEIPKSRVYAEFFKAPFVRRFCEQEGIDEATEEASKRRCPFLLSALAACGVVTLSQSGVKVEKLVITPALVQPHTREERTASVARVREVARAWPDKEERLAPMDVSVLRELFGKEFLTKDYRWKTLEIFEDA